MDIVPVIQFVVLMVYTVAYVNVWPIRRLGTIREYRCMVIMSVCITVFMLVTQAPAKVIWLFLGIILKDVCLMIQSGKK